MSWCCNTSGMHPKKVLNPLRRGTQKSRMDFNLRVLSAMFCIHISIAFIFLSFKTDT